VQDVSPETGERTVISIDGDDAAHRCVTDGGEIVNLGFRMRCGAASSPATRP
jgi:hypothetical protein